MRIFLVFFFWFYGCQDRDIEGANVSRRFDQDAVVMRCDGWWGGLHSLWSVWGLQQQLVYWKRSSADLNEAIFENLSSKCPEVMLICPRVGLASEAEAGLVMWGSFFFKINPQTILWTMRKTKHKLSFLSEVTIFGPVQAGGGTCLGSKRNVLLHFTQKCCFFAHSSGGGNVLGLILCLVRRATF